MRRSLVRFFARNKKKAWITSSRLKTTRERFKLQRSRIEVELNDHAGFFRGGLVFPLHHGGHYCLNQHRISAQDFYVLYSAVSSHQQLNAGASNNVVSFGQLGINRVNPVFDLANRS